MDTALEHTSTSSNLDLPDSAIEELVVEISQIARSAPLKMAHDIGQLIIQRIYHNDLNHWRDRGTKDTSFRKLANRPDLPLSITPVALYRSVAVYEIIQRWGDVSSWKHISVTHVQAVIGLTEKEQDRLLTEAEKKKLTAGQIADKAAKLRKKTSKGGRHALPGFVKGLNLFEKNHTLLLEDLTAVESMPEDQLGKLRHDVNRLIDTLHTLADKLEHATTSRSSG